MTCAHIVDVALNKLPAMEKADVSLNKSLIAMKLKPGNTLSILQIWKLIHDKGYTPKDTVVSVRGDLVNTQGVPQLKVSGTNDVLTLASDPANAAAWTGVTGAVGRIAIVDGVMMPGKDLKTAMPLRVNALK